jgi:hypothetical protein
VFLNYSLRLIKLKQLVELTLNYEEKGGRFSKYKQFFVL